MSSRTPANMSLLGVARFLTLGGFRSDTSFALRPLSIPRRTLEGDFGLTGTVLLVGEPGTCTAFSGRGSRLSRSCIRLAGRFGGNAADDKGREPCELSASLPSKLDSAFAFCSFFSFNRASIAASLSCSVSSSSSSSSSSDSSKEAALDAIGVGAERFVGEALLSLLFSSMS